MFKNALLLLIFASAPIMLFSYGWGMKLLFREVGPVVFLVFCAAHAMAWIAVAFLFDSRQPPTQTPKRER
jgi:hypothetical protein